MCLPSSWVCFLKTESTVESLGNLVAPFILAGGMARLYEGFFKGTLIQK